MRFILLKTIKNFKDTFQQAKSQYSMRKAFPCVKKKLFYSAVFVQMTEKSSWFSMFLGQPEIC